MCKSGRRLLICILQPNQNACFGDCVKAGVFFASLRGSTTGDVSKKRSAGILCVFRSTDSRGNRCVNTGDRHTLGGVALSAFEGVKFRGKSKGKKKCMQSAKSETPFGSSGKSPESMSPKIKSFQ